MVNADFPLNNGFLMFPEIVNGAFSKDKAIGLNSGLDAPIILRCEEIQRLVAQLGKSHVPRGKLHLLARFIQNNRGQLTTIPARARNPAKKRFGRISLVLRRVEAWVQS